MASAYGLIMPQVMYASTKPKMMDKTAMTRPKILFFDVNETLLDLTQMKKVVGEVLHGNEELLSLWFSTMLHYSLVTTASGRYEHFGHIGAAALQMVAANHGISLSKDNAREVVLNSLRGLPAHPEVHSALQQLKDHGYTMVSFTNSSNEGVRKQFESANLTQFFDARLSVEDVGKFKPFKETYAWGAKKMGIQPKDAMLIAAHGWDVAGANWAGWRSAFIKRPGKQQFPLAPTSEIMASDLQKVADVLVSFR